MKRIMSVILIVSLLLGIQRISLAGDIKEGVLTSKQIFASKYSSEYREGFAGTEEDLERYKYLNRYLASTNYLDDLNTQSKTTNLTVADEKLNSLGFYIYAKGTDTTTPKSDPGDYIINNPIILYDSPTDRWIVSGGGTWANNDWQDDTSLYNFLTSQAGATCDIGGVDGIGVALYGVSGTVPVLLSSTGYIHDGNGNGAYYYNPANLDSSRGVFFEYQDHMVLHQSSLSWDNITYMGYGFAASAVYDSSFAQYNGRARTCYAHTWGETTITGIGISTTGFNVSFDHLENKRYVVSGGETAF